jgi:hypothetical protein
MYDLQLLMQYSRAHVELFSDCPCHQHQVLYSIWSDAVSYMMIWYDIVTWRLKAGIVKPERKSIGSQRLAKHVPAATNRRWSPLLANDSISTFPWQQMFSVVTGILYKEPCRERIDQGQSQVKVMYDRRSVGQSVLVSSTHLGLTTRFLFVRQ